MANQNLSARLNIGVANIVVPGTSAGLVSASGLPGNTGSAIASGYVGETLTASRVRSNGLTLTANTPANVATTTFTLTPGVWLLSGMGGIKCGTSTSFTFLSIGIATSSAAALSGDLSAAPANGQALIQTGGAAISEPTSTDIDVSISPYTYVVTSNTTFYLVANAGFTGGAPVAYGSYQAVRIA